MRRYSKDPRTMTARFASKCSKCGEAIAKGDAIFYYPASKSAYGSKCGCAEQGQGEFTAAAQDEEFYASLY